MNSNELTNKIDINDLIAGKIIDMGIEETTEFNTTIFLEELEDIFSPDLIKYIKDNVNDIVTSINKNDKVADINLDTTNFGFDMVFYWGFCLDEKQTEILKCSEKLGIELDYEDIVNLGNDLWLYDSNNENKTRKKYINNLISDYEPVNDREL